EPNSLAGAGEEPGPRAMDQGFQSLTRLGEPTAEKRRIRAETFADHFSQARLFYQSQSKVEQGHIVAAIVFELSKVTLPHVRQRALGQLQNIDAELARRIASGLGIDLPAAIAPARQPVKMVSSDALSILKQEAPNAGRSLAILVSDGADATIVEGLMAAATAAKAAVKVIAPKVGGVQLTDGKMLPADEKIDGAPSVLFDAIALVLSAEGAQALTGEKAALDFVSDAYAHCKAIGYTPAAQALLKKVGAEPDDFFSDLTHASDQLIARLSKRIWDREPKVKQPL
ncbi:MAG: catalase-related domain-containing protein, partial [bacterium]